MNVQVNLKLVWTSSGDDGTPAWVEMPKRMRFYGSKEFRDLTVTMTIRKPFMASSGYDKAAILVAHEFSHVVLNSLSHPLRNCEKAVDLTAMLLGFSALYESGAHTERRTGNTITRSQLGYLTAEEVRTAYRLLVPADARLKTASRRALVNTLKAFAGIIILWGAIGAWVGAGKVSGWWKVHQQLLSDQAELQKQIPKRINADMTLVGVSVGITSLTYTVTLKEKIDMAGFAAAARKSACENKKQQIKAGAEYDFEFLDRSNRLIRRFEVSSCP
jgi:hypothetical protein